MQAFLEAAGVLCLLYFLLIIIFAGITADFSWIWVLGSAVCLGLSRAVYYETAHPGFFPGWMKTAFLVIVLAALLIFLVLCAAVIRGMTWKGKPELSYVVVLGAQVKGEAPSKALVKRLERVLEYARENPDTVLILSGGQGPGEMITEADCMAQYLTDRGISPERMILEEKSTNTRENLLFSDALTGCANDRTGILSNNFHVYRAVKLAENLGYTHPSGIAAHSDPVMQVHYVVREVFALLKELMRGHIFLGKIR